MTTDPTTPSTQAAPTTPRNETPVRDGCCSAICTCCGKVSHPVRALFNGEPSTIDLAPGWSIAMFSRAHVHPDGSVGTTYTCPACNRSLRSGSTLL